MIGPSASRSEATALLGVMKDGRCQSNAISCGTMVSQCREFWARALYLLEMEQDINEVTESKTLYGFCPCFLHGCLISYF